MSLWNGPERKRLWVLLGGSVASAAILLVAARYNAAKQQPVAPFRFPTKELAALDRDLQARFAVVPDKEFGIERTYGYQHYLYNPQSGRERATISALKKKNTDVAFYLMSRSLWLRSWDGYGYKPIQGPVHVTGKITLPLPRAINFTPEDNKVGDAIIDQEHVHEAPPFIPHAGEAPYVRHPAQEQGLPTNKPDGTPVSSPTPPVGAPSVNALQEIGNHVFEMAEDNPKTARIGLSQQMNQRWKVVAVPIRASQKACLPCHTYQPQPPNPHATSRTSVEVGDALGVAFYLYAVSEQQRTPRQTARDTLAK